jgi:hypothetical protein
VGNLRYSLSFATGGLFHRESVKVAALYLELHDWSAVRDRVISQNILQARTASTLGRTWREVAARLKNLNDDEYNFLVDATHQEQVYILWLAICRRYRFIADFAIDVLHERFITLKAELNYEDFDSFFNRKSEWHSELEKIRPDTRNKLRRVLFKMLRDADLLTANNWINAAMLSPRLMDLISHGNRREVLYFPTFESDLKGILS